MSLITILILGAVLGIVWRLLRLAVRVAAIANYGSHVARQGHPAPPAVQHRR